jgi:hypothetical protein
MRSNEGRDAAPIPDARPPSLPMTTPETPDSVRPALREAEAKLAQHLEEACEEYDRENIADESTDELLRLEEELLGAARAVDDAVRLRRRLGDEKGTAEQGTAERETAEKGAAEMETAGPEPAPADAQAARVREFRTASGSEWRVWEVRPGAGGRARKLELYPVDYVQGWLAFELLQGERRKRLPKFGPEWSKAPDSDLEQLLDQAVDVPKRKPRPEAGPGPAPEPPPSESAGG